VPKLTGFPWKAAAVTMTGAPLGELPFHAFFTSNGTRGTQGLSAGTRRAGSSPAAERRGWKSGAAAGAEPVAWIGGTIESCRSRQRIEAALLARRRHELGRRRLARRERGGERIAAWKRCQDLRGRRGTRGRLRLEAAEDHALERGVEVARDGRRMARRRESAA